MIYKSYLYEL